MVVNGRQTDSPSVRPAPEPQRQVRLGAIPSESAAKIQDQYKDFIQYLEKQTGYQITLTVAKDYATIIKQMRDKELDIAYFGPYSYIIAHETAGAQAFAIPESRRTGSNYSSLIITHAHSGIDSIEGLKGRSFAFVDRESTSGYLIPKAVLLKHGLVPDRDLRVSVSGRHDASVIAVRRQTVDAASVSENVLKALLEKGIVSETEFRVLYKSPPIPQSVWAYREGISPEVLEKIKQAFFNARLAPGALGQYAKDISGFNPVDDSGYDIIRETAKLLENKVYEQGKY